MIKVQYFGQVIVLRFPLLFPIITVSTVWNTGETGDMYRVVNKTSILAWQEGSENLQICLTSFMNASQVKPILGIALCSLKLDGNLET